MLYAFGTVPSGVAKIIKKAEHFQLFECKIKGLLCQVAAQENIVRKKMYICRYDNKFIR